MLLNKKVCINFAPQNTRNPYNFASDEENTIHIAVVAALRARRVHGGGHTFRAIPLHELCKHGQCEASAHGGGGLRWRM